MNRRQMGNVRPVLRTAKYRRRCDLEGQPEAPPAVLFLGLAGTLFHEL
jgi:hypothetical protein